MCGCAPWPNSKTRTAKSTTGSLIPATVSWPAAYRTASQSGFKFSCLQSFGDCCLVVLMVELVTWLVKSRAKQLPRAHRAGQNQLGDLQNLASRLKTPMGLRKKIMQLS